MMIRTARGDRDAMLWLRGRLIGHRLPELNCGTAGVTVRVALRAADSCSLYRPVSAGQGMGTTMDRKTHHGALLPGQAFRWEIAQGLLLLFSSGKVITAYILRGTFAGRPASKSLSIARASSAQGLHRSASAVLSLVKARYHGRGPGSGH